MSTNTAFALPTETDERNELAAVGIDLNKPMSDVELKAHASDLLRQLGDAAKEKATLAATRDAELARITMRYASQIDGLTTRASYLEQAVIEIAKRVDFGTKKSAKVGYGTFGKREKAERIAIVDQDHAVSFARAAGLTEAINVKETVTHAIIAPIILHRLHTTGELPDGFEHHDATTEYYAKVELE